VSEPQESRFAWGVTEGLLTVVWFAGFVAFQMIFRDKGLLAALEQFLSPINIAISVAVIFGILGGKGLFEGFRGKRLG
jgi:hypothetical protein